MSEATELERAAVAMTKAAEQGRAVAPVLRQRCPRVYQQLLRDRHHPALFSLWGRSLNVDEVARQTIVHPAIVSAIGAVTGIPMRGRIVHAGLEHTYGYLFSLIETPYGAKRDRWTSVSMERGFGVDRTLFSSRPREGSLLANVTWFLTRIVNRGRPRAAGRLAKSRSAVASELIEYDYAPLQVTRVIEEGFIPGGPRLVRLITDLVPYPHPPADPDGESTLLIYSVQSGTKAPLKLITTFPLLSQAARALEDAARAGGTIELRPRYNAYVRGLSGRVVRGSRSLFRLPAQN